MNAPQNRWSPEARPESAAPEALEKPGGHEEAAGLAPGTSQEAAAAGEERPNARREEAKGLELNAIIGAGTAFHGSLSFSGKVRIDGEFEGTARGGALLIIGEGAHVAGQVSARRVVILGGAVEADIQAGESIEIYLPAVVSGDLKSPQIYMDRGIQFQGTCDMTADPPPVEKANPEGLSD